MKAEVVSDVVIDEVVDGTRLVQVRRQALRLPAEGSEPPLAVERTTAFDTPQATVVLIHGFAQNRYTWRVTGRSFVAALAEAGFEVLNLELRGHGLSRAYGAGNARSFHEYVTDAVRVVKACEAPPFIIGHSLGGAVGIGASTQVDIAGLVHLAGVYTFARANATLRALGRITLELEPAMASSRVRLSTGWAGRLLGRLYSITEVAGYGFPISGWVPDSIERPLLEERLALGFDWTSVEVWLQMARWTQGEPLAYREAFQAGDTPLLVAFGDHDPLVREADARACFDESGAVDKRIVAFDAFHNRVHWGHVDLILGKLAPQEVWPVLIDWMQDRA